MLLRLSEVFRRRAGTPEIIILAVLYVLTVSAMVFVLIPAIFRDLPGMTIFDLTSTGYDAAHVIALREGISARGMDIYTKLQLPLDFVFPVIYGLFYLALGNKLFGRVTAPLLVAVTALCVSDYVENSLSYYLLLAQDLNASMVVFASAVTMLKTALIFIVTVVLLRGIVVAASRRKKRTPPE